MKKQFAIILAGATAAGLLGGIHQTLEAGKTDPHANAHHYDGVPFPGGSLFRQITGAFVQADMLNSGEVNTEIIARGNTLLAGKVACNAGKVNLSVQAALGLDTFSVRGIDIFHPPTKDVKIETISGICDGNRISETAVPSGDLAHYIMNQVINPGVIKQFS